MRKVFGAFVVFRVEGVPPRSSSRSFNQQPIPLPHEDRGLSTYVDLARFRLVLQAFCIVSVFFPSFFYPRVPTQRTGFSVIDAIRLSRSSLGNAPTERAFGNRVCAYLGEHGNLQWL